MSTVPTVAPCPVSPWLRSLVGVLALCVALAPAASFAQDAAESTEELDPIRCWRQTSAGAVRTGETFSVALTCAVLETDATRVVPDETKLDPAVAQFPPFELVDGEHPSDIRVGRRRFSQYIYQLRAIDRDLIGTDVSLTSLEVSYRIESRLPGNAAQLGRDLVYLLPPQSVRVLSMVPADASDIRDTTVEAFSRIESLRSRGALLRVAAILFAVLGSVTVVLAFAGFVRRGLVAARAGDRPLADARLARLAHETLVGVRESADQSGWSGELATKALAATRVVAAGLLERTVSQRTAGSDPPAVEGALISHPRGRRRHHTIVSSAITAADMSRANDGSHLAQREPTFDGVAQALTTFTAAAYGAGAALDREALDGAVTQALLGADAFRAAHRWPRALVHRWSWRAEAGGVA